MKPGGLATASAGQRPSPHEKSNFDSPEQTVRVFAAALGRGDLDVAIACFARDGCFLTPDATAVLGRDDIRPILAQMLAGCRAVRVETRGLLTAGETALGSERWTLGSNGPDGEPFERTSTSLVVLAKIEGDWKLTILAPWAEGSPAL